MRETPDCREPGSECWDTAGRNRRGLNMTGTVAA